MATTTMAAAPQQQQESSSSKNSFLAIIIFMVVLVAGIFYVKPLWDDVSSLSLGRDDKMQQKEQLSSELQSLQSIQQQISQSSEVAQQTTMNAIPQRLEQDKLITDLTSIAKTNDMILNTVSFSINFVNSDRIKKANLNANLTGDLGGLLNFLKGVEANPRKLSVKTVSIQTGTTETGLPRVNFNVNMEAYYLDRI